MGKFRKKPIVIEAMHHTGDESIGPILAWAGRTEDRLVWGEGGRIHIRTLEGEMQARVGDWIIKGVAGEFYPCKPDIFKATYEAVED